MKIQFLSRPEAAKSEIPLEVKKDCERKFIIAHETREDRQTIVKPKEPFIIPNCLESFGTTSVASK